MSATASPRLGKPIEVETGSIRSVSRSSIASQSRGDNSKWESNLLRVRSGTLESNNTTTSGYAVGGPKSPTDTKDLSSLDSPTASFPTKRSSSAVSSSQPYAWNPAVVTSAFQTSPSTRSSRKVAPSYNPGHLEIKRASVLDSLTGIKDPTYDGLYTTPQRPEPERFLAVTNPLVAVKQIQTAQNKPNNGGFRFGSSPAIDPDTEKWAGLVQEGASPQETLALAEQQAQWNLSEKLRLDAEAEARRQKEAANQREAAELKRLETERRRRIKAEEKALDRQEKAERKAAEREQRAVAKAAEQQRRDEEREARNAERRLANEQRQREAEEAREAALARGEEPSDEPVELEEEELADEAEDGDEESFEHVDGEEISGEEENADFHSAVDEGADSEAGSSVTETGTATDAAVATAATPKRGGLLRRLSSSFGPNYKDGAKETNHLPEPVGTDEVAVIDGTASADGTNGPPLQRRKSWLARRLSRSKKEPVAHEVEPVAFIHANGEEGETGAEDAGEELAEPEAPTTDADVVPLEGEAEEVEGAIPTDAVDDSQQSTNVFVPAGPAVKRRKSWLARRFSRSKKEGQQGANGAVIAADGDDYQAEEDAAVEPTTEGEPSASQLEEQEALDAAQGSDVEAESAEPVASTSEFREHIEPSESATVPAVPGVQSGPKRRKSWLSKLGKNYKSYDKETAPATTAPAQSDLGTAEPVVAEAGIADEQFPATETTLEPAAEQAAEQAPIEQEETDVAPNLDDTEPIPVEEKGTAAAPGKMKRRISWGRVIRRKSKKSSPAGVAEPGASILVKSPSRTEDEAAEDLAGDDEEVEGDETAAEPTEATPLESAVQDGEVTKEGTIPDSEPITEEARQLEADAPTALPIETVVAQDTTDASPVAADATEGVLSEDEAQQPSRQYYQPQSSTSPEGKKKKGFFSKVFRRKSKRTSSGSADDTGIVTSGDEEEGDVQAIPDQIAESETLPEETHVNGHLEPHKLSETDAPAAAALSEPIAAEEKHASTMEASHDPAVEETQAFAAHDIAGLTSDRIAGSPALEATTATISTNDDGSKGGLDRESAAHSSLSNQVVTHSTVPQPVEHKEAVAALMADSEPAAANDAAATKHEE